ncbi:MAG: NAD(P)H-binding protein [Cryomorphaceae bacterium]
MKAVVAGGTGLTGGFLLRALEENAEYTEVTAISRRLPDEKFEKVKWAVIDLNDNQALAEACKGADVAFCALGTTIKAAGSKEAFRKVDFEYVKAFAEAAREGGCRQFHVVSAIGASAGSSVFYNKVKGEAEEALREIGFDTLGIYQPSFLKGPRAEPRLGEKIGGAVMNLLSPIMAGGLKKYKPIHVNTVARAMAAAALEKQAGVSVFTYSEMERLSK